MNQHPHLTDTSGPDSPLFWVYFVGLVLALFFVFRYARYSDWRSTMAGRAIMSLAGSIVVTLLYAAGARLFEPPPAWRVTIGLVLLGIVDVALFNLCRVLLKFQGGFLRGHSDGTELDRSVSQK